MTDEELMARLRKADEYEPLGHDGWEAADRIKDLTDKLAKAVEVLVFYATQDVIYPHVGKVTFTGYDDDGRLARATLAEIKGESHE